MSKANVGTYDPELDTVISFEEVCITIKSTKNHHWEKTDISLCRIAI